MAGIGRETSTYIQTHDVPLPELGRELGHPPVACCLLERSDGKERRCVLLSFAVTLAGSRKWFLSPFKIMIVFVRSVLGPACNACVEARQLYAGSGVKLRP